MKKIERKVSAACLGILLATGMGCAASLPQESAGEYVDDAVITTKVKASILDQPGLKSSEIHVQTFKGAVYLSGYVASQASIDRAVEIARSVNGVRSVKNDMRLQ